MALYLVILTAILLAVSVSIGIFHPENVLISAALYTLSAMLSITVLLKLPGLLFTALAALVNSVQNVL
jgi:hypothetical protein